MSFSTLIERAQRGDPDAVEELYARYSARVRSAVRRRLSPGLRRRLDSTDVVQSVFAEVLRDLPRFEDRGEPAFRHWLTIKATNKVRDKLRKYLGRDGHRDERPLEPDTPLVCGDRSPPSQAEAREEGERATTLLEMLDRPGRQVVHLRLDLGLTFGEIANRLDLSSEDAARKRYARAVLRLRTLWAS